MENTGIEIKTYKDFVAQLKKLQEEETAATLSFYKWCSRHRNERVADAYYRLFTRFAWLQYNNDVNDITQKYKRKQNLRIFRQVQLFDLSSTSVIHFKPANIACDY